MLKARSSIAATMAPNIIRNTEAHTEREGLVWRIKYSPKRSHFVFNNNQIEEPIIPINVIKIENLLSTVIIGRLSTWVEPRPNTRFPR